MAFKVYREGNYIFVESTVTGKLEHSYDSVDVRIEPDFKIPTLYRFYDCSKCSDNGLRHEFFFSEIADLQEKDTTPYTDATFQSFYSKQTGTPSEVLLNTFFSSSDPTVTDDSDSVNSYFLGQHWINTTTDKTFIAKDLTVGAAQWDEIIQSIGGTVTIDDLVKMLTLAGIGDRFIQADADGNLKVTSLTPEPLGIDVIPLFSSADFPAPSGGIITLTTGLYVMKDSFSISDRFQAAVGAVIEFQCEDKENHTLTYTGTGILFEFLDFARFKIEHASFVLSGNGATFCDCAIGSTKFNDHRITFTGTGGTLGTFRDNSEVFGTNEVVDATHSGFVNGWLFDDIGGLQVINSLYLNDGSGTDAVITVKTTAFLVANLLDVTFTIGQQPAVFLDPVLNSPIRVNQSIITGGILFEPGVKGAFSTISDLTNTNAVTAVLAGAFGSDFKALLHGYKVGDIIVHTTFVDPRYNGTFTITAIPDVNTYEIASIIFAATDTGTGTVNEVRVTSVSHPLLDGDRILITDTINYNEGFEVHNVGVNVFDIYVVFVITEAGNWDTGSLTEDSKYVLANDNGDKAPSRNIAFGEMNANATATVVALADTYQAVDLSTVIENAETSRFTLIDTVAGIFRYDGLPPFKGAFTANISMLKAGATQNYRLTSSINGSLPVFTAIGATAITSVTDSGGIARFNHAGTDPFVTQLVVISGFVTNVLYNITGEVTVSGAGFFEISSIAFGTDETGSFLSNITNYAPIEIKTTKVATTVIKPLELSPGDTVQIMIAGEGTSDNLTLTDVIIEAIG